MKRRFIGVTLALGLAAGILGGCSSKSEQNSEAAVSTTAATAAKDFKMAMVSSEIGAEAFNLNAYNAMMAASETYGFQCLSVECTDTAAWEENIMAASEEGYDLIVGIGWNSADAIAKAADLYPDCRYVVVDSVCSNDKVTSITFREEEGAYVQGVMLATAFPEDDIFGYVCSYQTQATYQYRYGYEQGIKSVNPDARLIYNYINSYNDTSMVYEYAVQQQAAGCNVIIGGVSSSANYGLYQACLEQGEKGTPIYTTGLSVDQTTVENPYILGGLLKDTGACMKQVIEEFIDGTLAAGERPLGLKEGAFGVLYVTMEESNYRNKDIMKDEVLEAGRAAADKIIAMELKLEVPEESAK